MSSLLLPERKVLRPFQLEALDALRTPGSVICVSPTGSGKSLIYEEFALRARLRMLLVTPLVALARQQRRRIEEAGIPVSGEGGGPPPSESGSWIVSPETLLYPGRRAALERWRPHFLVVDECHCLWDWGERFRPAFLRIPELLRLCPSIRRSLWLTATLPLEARRELKGALVEAGHGPVRELGRFALPPTLHIEARRVAWPDRLYALLPWVEARRGPGIVFVQTRDGTQRVTRLLEAAGLRAMAYHAGMSAEERRAIEDQVARGIPDAVVATSAFGMGMDYSHLQWVAMWQAPPSLLLLTQAVGRVGRNPRDEARALILWDDEDFRLLEWTVGDSERRRAELARTREYLNTVRCRRASLRAHFEGRAEFAACGRCDLCGVRGAVWPRPDVKLR